MARGQETYAAGVHEVASWGGTRLNPGDST